MGWPQVRGKKYEVKVMLSCHDIHTLGMSAGISKENISKNKRKKIVLLCANHGAGCCIYDSLILFA